MFLIELLMLKDLMIPLVLYLMMKHSSSGHVVLGMALQELCSWRGTRSTYHEYCLHASHVQGANFDKYNYSRGKPYEDGTAICFSCMKLMYVNVNLGPKASQFDLMKDHYDYECSNHRTDFGRARLIQRLWKIFREREPSNARLSWNSLPNDNTPDDKNFLGLTSCKVKNSQTRDQFNLWNAEKIAMYKRCNPSMVYLFLNKKYEEYYIPYDWIGSKKNQLRDRFQKRLLEI
jgi:hypothetical protein